MPEDKPPAVYWPEGFDPILFIRDGKGGNKKTRTGRLRYTRLSTVIKKSQKKKASNA